MKLSLLVLSEGKVSGQSIPIKLSQFLIGRDAQCHLRPASPIISKRHCALIQKDGRVFLRDFNSTNGTFVNDERVSGQTELKNDDILKVGPVVFKVQIERTTPIDQPTPLPPHATSSGATGDDEDAAALLLLPDDGSVASAVEADAEGKIASGTTWMDLPSVGPEGEEAESDEASADEESTEAKGENQSASTANAAAEILAKYARRQRGREE